jgi:predicted amidohydrolase YtcJ
VRAVDARGLFALPGFVDGHIHPLSWSRHADNLSLGACRSVDDILSALQDELRNVEPGGWIHAVGVGEGRLIREGRLPNRHELDGVSRNHPIFVAGGTLAAANTSALKLSGLMEAADADVEGGRIERDESAAPTGILLGRGAIDWIRRVLPVPSAERDRETLRRFLLGLAAMGITAVVEFGSVDRETQSLEDYAVYSGLNDVGLLATRCRVAYRMNVGGCVRDEIANLQSKDPRELVRQDDVLRFGPFKAFTDGGVQGALLRGDYEGRPGYRGLALLERQDMDKLTAFAVTSDWQLSLHALGGGAIDAVLASWRGSADHVVGRRFSLQHAFDPAPTTFATCHELDVVVGVHQSLFYMYAPQMLAAWSGNVTEEINPVRSWLDSGVRVAGGSDIAPHDPLVAISSLMTRRTESGDVYGSGQAISAAEAINLLTSGAAYGNFDEHLYGGLSPGMAADIALIDQDISTLAPEDIPTATRVATFMNGSPTHVHETAHPSIAALAR